MAIRIGDNQFARFEKSVQLRAAQAEDRFVAELDNKRGFEDLNGIKLLCEDIDKNILVLHLSKKIEKGRFEVVKLDRRLKLRGFYVIWDGGGFYRHSTGLFDSESGFYEIGCAWLTAKIAGVNLAGTFDWAFEE